MENYLNENFGGVRSKNSSEEALRRWRRVCGVVKNRKRRFRFTANLSKRSEAEAMRRTNHRKFTSTYGLYNIFLDRASKEALTTKKDSLED